MCRSVDDVTTQGGEREQEDQKCGAKVQPLSPQPFMQAAQLDLHSGLSIFLFDWDDTLFPTLALTTCGPERLVPAFEVIDDLIVQLLEKALRVPRSRVILLTNANIQWIYHAAGEFLPKFSKWLEKPPTNMSIVSAHRPRDPSVDPQSADHAAEVAQRKNRVAQQMSVSLQELISQMEARMIQVLSIGDTPLDLEAAHVLASALVAEERYVKTVFMKPKPSAAELVWQQRTLLNALGEMAQMPRSFHQSMHWAQVPPPLVLRTNPRQTMNVPQSARTSVEASNDFANKQVADESSSPKGNRRRRSCNWKKRLQA
jgi:hypothetical protein